jgi:hypothetical protein
MAFKEDKEVNKKRLALEVEKNKNTVNCAVCAKQHHLKTSEKVHVAKGYSPNVAERLSRLHL